ncbi:MAG: hypothetical protein Ta2D_01410 [Rickettsiales bacterium]|nr:MAG: hypothetical protein Ta2D_01410 [Rickettsiales bacterium]
MGYQGLGTPAFKAENMKNLVVNGYVLLHRKKNTGQPGQPGQPITTLYQPYSFAEFVSLMRQQQKDHNVFQDAFNRKEVADIWNILFVENECQLMRNAGKTKEEVDYFYNRNITKRDFISEKERQFIRTSVDGKMPYPSQYPILNPNIPINDRGYFFPNGKLDTKKYGKALGEKFFLEFYYAFQQNPQAKVTIEDPTPFLNGLSDADKQLCIKIANAQLKHISSLPDFNNLIYTSSIPQPAPVPQQPVAPSSKIMPSEDYIQRKILYKDTNSGMDRDNFNSMFDDLLKQKATDIVNDIKYLQDDNYDIHYLRSAFSALVARSVYDNHSAAIEGFIAKAANEHIQDIIDICVDIKADSKLLNDGQKQILDNIQGVAEYQLRKNKGILIMPSENYVKQNISPNDDESVSSFYSQIDTIIKYYKTDSIKNQIHSFKDNKNYLKCVLSAFVARSAYDNDSSVINNFITSDGSPYSKEILDICNDIVDQKLAIDPQQNKVLNEIRYCAANQLVKNQQPSASVSQIMPSEDYIKKNIKSKSFGEKGFYSLFDVTLKNEIPYIKNLIHDRQDPDPDILRCFLSAFVVKSVYKNDYSVINDFITNDGSPCSQEILDICNDIRNNTQLKINQDQRAILDNIANCATQQLGQNQQPTETTPKPLLQQNINHGVENYQTNANSISSFDFEGQIASINNFSYVDKVENPTGKKVDTRIISDDRTILGIKLKEQPVKVNITFEDGGRDLTLKEAFTNLIREKQSLEDAKKEMQNILYDTLNSMNKSEKEELEKGFKTKESEEIAKKITKQILKELNLTKEDRNLTI